MIRFQRAVGIFVALLMISVVGCGEESEPILEPERHLELSENSVLATGAEDVPAAPALHEPLMHREWHDLSQSQRNQKILQRAYQDLGQKKGQCKPWVQDVVFAASNGAVYPPKNHPLKDRWRNDPKNTDSEYCIGRCGPITSASPGEIVQVRWKANVNPPDNLHTFIVVSVNASDSNGKNKQSVRKRTLQTSNFNKIADSFSIYYIR